MTPRTVRIARRTTAAVVTLLALTVAVGLLFRSLPREIPAPAGPFAVGRVVYSPQLNTLLTLWYPTVAGAPGLPADYFPGGALRSARQEAGLRRFLTQNLGDVRVNAIKDAPISPEDAAYPVVLLVPRSGLTPFSYTALAEQMASTGWVVAGVDPGMSGGVRAGLVDEALSFLRNLNDSGTGQFTGRLDLSHLALVGDLSGAVDFAALQGKRFPPIVPAVLFGCRPGGEWPTSPPGEPVLRLSPSGAGSSHAAVDIPIPGAKPVDFTDEGFLFSPAARLTGRLGSIPPEHFHLLVAELIETFVEGAWSAMDDGVASRHPDRRALLRNAISAATVAVREKALSYPILHR